MVVTYKVSVHFPRFSAAALILYLKAQFLYVKFSCDYSFYSAE